MTIGVWDYRDEYKELREEILAAVDGVFKSGRLILGEHVAAFEREFSDFCNLDTPGVGVNSRANRGCHHRGRGTPTLY